MDAELQKHRMKSWVGRLLVVFSLVASCSVYAGWVPLEPLPTIYWEAYAWPAVGTYASMEEACSHYSSTPVIITVKTNQTGTLSYVNCLGHPVIISTGQTPGLLMSYRMCPGMYQYFDWDKDMCYRWVRDDLTITLSGGTSVEPWHKKSDADHKKTNLNYTATVKDASGQPAPNVEVTITTDVTQDSGGHVHIDGRHKGKLAIPSDPIKDGKETITGNTDGNGVYSFVFGSEEASGTHTLTAKCSTGCQAPATATVKVEIQGLSLLDGDPLSYTLNGETSTHPGSHYFSAAALTKIINLAHKYSHDPAFNKQLLIINDSSLIKGGVLDLGQDWTYTPNGHQGHRVGVVVDINNFRDGQNSDFEDFAQRCCKIDAVWEGPDITATPHYHLKLLGKDQ